MKNLIIIALLASGQLLYAGGKSLTPVARGNTNHELGDFVIEVSWSPIIVDAKMLPTYEVRYQNSPTTIRIAIDDSNRKCRKYIVVSDNLSIQYNCDGRFFGASMLEESYIEDGVCGSCINLDRQEYFRQRVISQNVKSEMEHMKLISVYFPKLIRDYDTVLAAK